MRCVVLEENCAALLFEASEEDAKVPAALTVEPAALQQARVHVAEAVVVSCVERAHPPVCTKQQLQSTKLRTKEQAAREIAAV